ncbi:hypothetical protein K4F52_006513 [Lecanicillium sp. MT-2017a]|nr:hypothetical protein K4F52_006513 [Lecanicillium sp. MT-2017a]
MAHHGVESTPPGADFSGTKTRIKSAVYTTLLLAAICWSGGFFVVANGDSRLVLGIPISEAVTEGTEGLLLVVSLLVTFTSDSLGYVHATSLRWALFREGRLEYNTNFRLFTSARTSFANGRFMNLVSAASLVLSYACTSALVLRGKLPMDRARAANAMALLGLGLGLLGQVATAAICLRHHESRILSWSANPLWNTMVHLQDQALVKIENQSGCDVRPRLCDQRLAQTSRPDLRYQGCRLWHIRATKWIVMFMWALCVVAFVWDGIIIYIPTLMFNNNPFRFQWQASATDTTHVVNFGMDPNTNDPQINTSFPIAAQFLLGILFLCLVQGLQSMGLHCVELLVNMWRDEHTWRKAGRTQGISVMAAGPLFEALSSWRTVLLTAIKAIQHWLLGQAMVLHYHLDGNDSEFTFNMSPSRLLIFACVTVVTALFTTALALWPLHGVQPPAWGHLQTLAALVDDWEASDGRLRWTQPSEDIVDRHSARPVE